MVVVLVGRHAKQIIEASAAEVFPRETLGVLLGDPVADSSWVQAAYPYQSADRGLYGVETKSDESGHRLEDIFGDAIIGDYHSHPNEPAYLSKIREFKTTKNKEMSDEYDMLHSERAFDGMMSLVVSIYPGKRKSKPWLYRWVAYTAVKGKIHKVKIKFI